MRNKLSNIFWGIFLVVIGIGVAGKAFNFWDFTLLFEGWWTLLIIIPCAISMVKNGIGRGSTIGFIIGIFLLLTQRGVIEGGTINKLIVPIILVVIGWNIIRDGIFNGSKGIHIHEKYDKLGTQSAIFGGKSSRYPHEPFYGTEMNAIFGGVEFNLRDAIIEEDIVINCFAIFGGIDLFVPSNINVKVSSTSIFGGVSNGIKMKKMDGIPTIYVNATCMFGGVDIR